MVPRQFFFQAEPLFVNTNIRKCRSYFIIIMYSLQNLKIHGIREAPRVAGAGASAPCAKGWGWFALGKRWLQGAAACGPQCPQEGDKGTGPGSSQQYKVCVWGGQEAKLKHRRFRLEKSCFPAFPSLSTCLNTLPTSVPQPMLILCLKWRTKHIYSFLFV